MKKSIMKILDEYSLGVAILMIVICFIFAFSIMFGVLCLNAWLVMLLWNWVAVALFNAPTITFWLSFGLCLLVRFIFRGFKFFIKTEKD